jgi:hypothetical protein
MEPITVATAFASLVGLIRMYKAEVQEHDGRVFDGYIEWLRRQEHKQLVDLILGNDVLAQSVRDLIEDQHGEVMRTRNSFRSTTFPVCLPSDVTLERIESYANNECWGAESGAIESASPCA